VDPDAAGSRRDRYRLIQQMSSRLSVLAVAVLLFASAVGVAEAAEQRASLPDIEDEVMCPTCGVPLSHAFSPQAERQRAFIRAQIARGRSKEQIKQALVAEFGESVLAEPKDEGFELTAYLAPIGAVLIATFALAIGVFRWRRRRPEAVGPEVAPLSPADEVRLERDLSRYDA
jgi:cytochrome c-type biogenesis protein CcmH